MAQCHVVSSLKAPINCPVQVHHKQKLTVGQWTHLTRLCLLNARFHQSARELSTLCGLRQLAVLDLDSTNVPSGPE